MAALHGPYHCISVICLDRFKHNASCVHRYKSDTFKKPYCTLPNDGL